MKKIVDTYTIYMLMNKDDVAVKLNSSPVRVPGGRVSHGTPKGSGAEALAEFQGMASEVQGVMVRHQL